MKDQMFCYQCQEAALGTGCTVKGVCGKDFILARKIDLLIFSVRGISVAARELRKKGLELPENLGYFVSDSLFMTITNANFDKEAVTAQIDRGFQYRDQLIKIAQENKIELPQVDEITWVADKSKYDNKSVAVGVLRTENEDIRSLQELIVYGLKGMAAYIIHANRLESFSIPLDNFIQDTLASMTVDNLDLNALVALTLETGHQGVNAMALLDAANTKTYGNPEITTVNIGVGKRPGILISGHDLKDIQELLEQTEGTGVDVYTHGEMLPAHYYPAFKKYTHFIGNYGNAWWKQKEEFETFNGPILFTTNCIVPPLKNNHYIDRMYTTNASGYTGCVHIVGDENGHKDFSQIIEQAKTCAAPTEIETGSIVGGFAHQQVFALADKVVDAVKTGAIKQFFVMAGCDGRMKNREYYTDFAKELPHDTVILTAGCAKFRYNKLNLGDINGIPRVLDAGQCNDSYSLALIALKLKEIFELNDINELPISYNIAWYEQKAVIVLLALLALGVKNIHIGPTLPAFLSKNTAKVLIDNFGLATIGTVKDDLKLFLGE